MYQSPGEVQDAYNRRFKEAAIVFFIVMGLSLFVLIGLTLVMPRLMNAGKSGAMIIGGVTMLYAGVTTVIGTGLVKRWRWAAVAAVIGSILLMGLMAVSITSGSSEPPANTKSSEAFKSGRQLGSICPFVFILFVLISSFRAAIAKAPPPQRQHRGYDDIMLRDDVNPYGYQPAEAPRAVPVVALTFTVIGALIFLGGIAVLTMGTFKRDSEASLADVEWQRYDYPAEGFSIEAPEAPSIDAEFGGGPNIADSKLYEIVLRHHRLEVIYNRLGPTGYVLEDGLQRQLDGITGQMGGTVVSRRDVSVQNNPGLRYEVELPDGGRAFLLATHRDKFTYVVIAQEAHPESSTAAERFVDGFRYLDP